jgi:hypothetical protein
VKAVKKFVQIPFNEKKLLIEALWELCRARLLLLLVPFRRIAPGMGEHMKETAEEPLSRHLETLGHIRRALRRASRHTPWANACLVQALAGKNMLKRRGIPYTLYLGLTKNGKIEKGMKAHAWLRSGNLVLTGKQGVRLSSYTVVSMFAGDNR